MALYAVGDLHLSFGVNKPMDIFGGVWQNYIGKIEENFNKLSDDDTIILCGDISWAMGLSEALPDFKFIESLPGKKIILKGNHDYWWTTVTKMKTFLHNNGIFSVDFLYNNSFIYEKTAICGTRGWFYEEDMKNSDEKVFKRELIRLEASLTASKNTGADEIYCFLHYPPLYDGYRCVEIMELMGKYGVKKCYFGHLHDKSLRLAITGGYNGIEYSLVSADYLNFKPALVAK